MHHCTILILTYKGKKHLELLLPTVQQAISAAPNYGFDVLIVDNGSDKETAGFVVRKFPQYQIVAAAKNDYLFSLNAFVRELRTPFVFILNDDMKLAPDALQKIMPIISGDQHLFSVGCNVMDWEGSGTTVGVRLMEYSRGWMRNFFQEFPDDKIRYTLYGGGGAAVFRTKYFNILEGFNTLYRPAYAEDLDLGHRAWHQGWETVICPTAILYHRDGATIKEQFTSDALEQKINKNIILWMLRNVDVPDFLFFFFLLLPSRIVKWKKFQPNMYIAFKEALPKFAVALKQRKNTGHAKMTDKQIMKLLNKEYELKK